MNMLYFTLVILAIAQGITEFLPVSSSGHLVILEQIDFIKNSITQFGKNINLLINVALHVASLIAVIIFLRKDIKNIIIGFFINIYKKNYQASEIKISINIIAASIPAGIIGLLLHDLFEKIFLSIHLALIMLIFNGIILISTKTIPLKYRKIEHIGIFRSILIGLFQALAMIPGISRSGMTIAGGMFNGLDPVESAKFSFFMAIPVIAGAGFLEGLKAVKNNIPMNLVLPMIIAMLITFFVAMFSLKLLFKLVKQIKIDIFGYYTIALGLIGLIIVLTLK